MRFLIAASAVFLTFVSPVARARVFVRWTAPSIPAAKSLGVLSIVIPWADAHSSLASEARREGFRVFVEVAPDQAQSAAASASLAGLAGLIIAVPDSGPIAQAESTLGAPPGSDALSALMKKLHGSYPSLSVRRLAAGGMQPQMRGNLVVGNDGVLEVSRPSEQPWIDSNVALIRFEQARFPAETPLISFKWNLMDPASKLYGPPPIDYDLAVAEAGSFQTDVILPIHPHFQQELVKGNPRAWSDWGAIRRTIRFYSTLPGAGSARLISNIDVLTKNFESSYEATNLMARHNIAFRLFAPQTMESAIAGNTAMAAVFGPLDSSSARWLDAFAARGGTVILVGQTGDFPWHSAKRVRQNADAAVYAMGKGTVVKVAEPITDPEAFARDVWRLLQPEQRQLTLWNALTTLAAAYRTSNSPEVRLNLVNYSGSTVRVQARVKGIFSRIHFMTPEGVSAQLRAHASGGFTEFVTPPFRVGAVVRLSAKGGE